MKRSVNTVSKVLSNDSTKDDPTKEDRTRILMTGTVVLSSILIRQFDELEELGYKRFKIKQMVKGANRELEKYLDEVFDNLGNSTVHANNIDQLSRKVEEILNI